jgi:hypothetical protein
MADAAVAACVAVQGDASSIPGVTRNLYAELLSRLVTCYVLSEDRDEIGALQRCDIDGGTFQEGGREIFFADGRQTISGLAVTRTALKAAIEVLRGASGKKAEIRPDVQVTTRKAKPAEPSKA